MLRNDKYYSMNEAIELIGISRQSLYTWEKQGKIKPPKKDLFSGRRLYTKKEIDTMVKMRQGIGTLSNGKNHIKK